MTDQDRRDLASADPQGMLDVVCSSPDLWAQGSAIGRRVTWQVERPTAIVVAGMGGSGIAGDVATLVAGDAGAVPVVVAKGYDLPAWAGPSTPVIAVSHSGNTEETLAVTEAAVAAGCPVAAVTSGGRLSEVVSASGGPIVSIPGDHQPRASFPLLVPPTLALLAAAGVVGPEAVDASTVSAALEPRMQALQDQAAAAVQRVADHVPIFVGGRGLAALVAVRAKCQMNENAEVPAFANELPEANHNEIVGWGGGPQVPYAIVPIRDAAGQEPQRVSARFDVTGDLLSGVTTVLDPVRLPEGGWLQRLAAGVVYVDLLSVYLALALKVDPTPVQRISELKRRMESV